MQLDLSKKYQVLLGEASQVNICLVGVGGTGSALALSLGRLAYHLKEKGISVNMSFVDHDIVEESNFGRQNLEICGIIGGCCKIRLKKVSGIAGTRLHKLFLRRPV